jgi:hypothetical protein
MSDKCNEHTILCDCGHPLGDHQSGGLRCYHGLKRTERRKNHLGKYVKVKCAYICYCPKFEQLKEDVENAK